MSSNYLVLRSVWKSLVASCVCVCVCVAQVRTRVSTRSSPALKRSSPTLKCSSPARNAFDSSTIRRSSSN